MSKGVTLIEVLIAMGVLTIGLLSVASLFTVGAFYVRQGEVQDRARVIAEEAFNDIIAYRMLDTPRWIMYNEDEGMFNQSVTETIKHLHMTDQQHKMEQVVGSVFVLDPVAIGSVNFKGDSNNASRR